MNFEFSDEQNLLREQVRRFLSENAGNSSRRILEGTEPFDEKLWISMAELGWLGTIIPEEFGGAGSSYEDLCVIAEEVGRSLAATPFSSSVYLATETILLAGSKEQKIQYLTKLATGELIGTVALFADSPNITKPNCGLTLLDGKLTGEVFPVPDGDVANIIIVSAKTKTGQPILALAELTGVTTEVVNTIDPSRSHAKIVFENTPATPLGRSNKGFVTIQRIIDRAAILFAFEQLGGAQMCLELATEFAKNRFVFGRPIGSFQAIKHKLADVYIATELARSHAYYGAWALTANAADLPIAAAAARIASSRAYNLASSENIQTHGGIGFTWELDCHLYYRRAKLLSLTLGGERQWKNKLVSRLENRNLSTLE